MFTTEPGLHLTCYLNYPTGDIMKRNYHNAQQKIWALYITKSKALTAYLKARIYIVSRLHYLGRERLFFPFCIMRRGILKFNCLNVKLSSSSLKFISHQLLHYCHIYLTFAIHTAKPNPGP